MKRIILGNVQVVPSPGVPAQPQSVAEAIRGWLAIGDPARGMNFEEMGYRLDLIKKFREANSWSYIDLEEAEHAIVVQALNSTRLSMADEGLFEARNRVIQAETPPSAKLEP